MTQRYFMFHVDMFDMNMKPGKLLTMWLLLLLMLFIIEINKFTHVVFGYINWNLKEKKVLLYFGSLEEKVRLEIKGQRKEKERYGWIVFLSYKLLITEKIFTK